MVCLAYSFIQLLQACPFISLNLFDSPYETRYSTTFPPFSLDSNFNLKWLGHEQADIFFQKTLSPKLLITFFFLNAFRSVIVGYCSYFLEHKLFLHGFSYLYLSQFDHVFLFIFFNHFIQLLYLKISLFIFPLQFHLHFVLLIISF